MVLVRNHLLCPYSDCIAHWRDKIPRIKFGKKQSVETLINEEILVFAKHLRAENGEWVPRIVIIF